MRIIFVPIHIGTLFALYLCFKIALESENKYLNWQRLDLLHAECLGTPLMKI